MLYSSDYDNDDNDRMQSLRVRQVQEIRASGIHRAVLSVLAMVEDYVRLAGIASWSMATASTQKAD